MAPFNCASLSLSLVLTLCRRDGRTVGAVDSAYPRRMDRPGARRFNGEDEEHVAERSGVKFELKLEWRAPRLSTNRHARDSCCPFAIPIMYWRPSSVVPSLGQESEFGPRSRSDGHSQKDGQKAKATATAVTPSRRPPVAVAVGHRFFSQ